MGIRRENFSRHAWKICLIALPAALVCCGSLLAQGTPPPSPEPAPPSNELSPMREPTIQSPFASCEQPLPVLSWDDYQGPYAKTVSAFARRLDRTSAPSLRSPRYKPGARLCTLGAKDKFLIFANDSIDPVAFLTAAFNAGIGQAEDADPSYGQGAAGYGKRVGFYMIDQAQGEFFKYFLYPVIFSEDPRYYRLVYGTPRDRLFHALEHVFVAHKEDGSPMPNFSEWLGTSSAVALANVYHPDRPRGFGPAAESVAFGMSQDAGWDVLREFWPEVARKLKLPFKDKDQP